jgi:hypothetical protein
MPYFHKTVTKRVPMELVIFREALVERECEILIASTNQVI